MVRSSPTGDHEALHQTTLTDIVCIARLASVVRRWGAMMGNVRPGREHSVSKRGLDELREATKLNRWQLKCLASRRRGVEKVWPPALS